MKVGTAKVRNSSLIGRVAGVGAVVIALIAVIVIVLGGGSSYTVNAVFENASQIVKGDEVEVGGVPIGTVQNIALTAHGQAELTLNITNSKFTPLRQGTHATIRELSLSGIASRYVDLNMGPPNSPKIPNGGTISQTSTTSEVDIDQLFNTLNAPTRRGLQELIQGTASQYAGAGKKAQIAWQYLNPAIASSTLLFDELNKDTSKFTRFIVKSGNLFADIATRQADLSALIRNLNTTTSALAAQHTALGQSISQLPGFMRLANTTFVNLRTALNVLTPLVNASKPVAPKLQKLLVQLRPLAVDSVPTVRDLANIVSKPGAANDLTDLVRLGVPLADATVRNIRADGKLRPGAFPESSKALNGSTPELAFARPYAVDLTGWFEGFSHPGGYDANGGYSRVAPVIGVASLNNGILNLLPSLLQPSLRAALAYGSGSTPGSVTTNYGDRCPGSMERGAMWYPYPGYACSPNQQPTGS
ncbi:MAG TPA: MlaD family protein [Solirubrobacteraceae bacterium]|nr:MlaD family protein [Solirubrobacteraceae bacterium]